MEHKKLRKQFIGEHTVIFTDSVHTFGTDGVLLSDFANPKKQDKTLELGTGCGIISLLWCRQEAPSFIEALELQPDAVDLVNMAIAENGLQNRLSVTLGDLKTIDQYFSKGYYDLVVMNPPYKRADDGVVSPVSGLAIARHELECTLQDICNAASTVLNTGGRFCMCHRPGRLAEVMVAMVRWGIEPKRLQMVHQSPSQSPNLFLIEGKKGSNPGLTVEPPLFMEDDNGNPSKRIQEIYSEYYQQRDKNI